MSRSVPTVRSFLSRDFSLRAGGKYLILGLLVIGGAWMVQLWIAGLGWVPSSSMEAGLRRGDLVVVYRGPYEQSNPLGRALWRQGFGTVGRYDILVVQSPLLNLRWTNPPGVAGSPSADRRVDQRAKRVIGLPGDTVDVHGGTLFVNSAPERPLSTGQDYWVLDKPVESHRIDLFRMGIPDVKERGHEVVAGPATAEQMALLRTRGTIGGARRCVACFSQAGRWIVPQEDVLIAPQDRSEAERLAWLIRTYENRPASVSQAGDLVVNGIAVRGYAFQESYLFVAGDNRPQSVDSRSTGPIPFSLVRGKVIRIVASWSTVRRELRNDRFWMAPGGAPPPNSSSDPTGRSE
jgi:signal peptidase I